MSFTLDTSHFEISALNKAAPMKMALMSATLDTSHSPTNPCPLSEQSPLGDSLRHALTALFSFALDCGENTNWPAQNFIKAETRRAKMMTWQCGSEWIGTCWCIFGSLRKAMLTVDANGALGMEVDIQVAWVNRTFDCEMGGCLHFARILGLVIAVSERSNSGW